MQTEGAVRTPGRTGNLLGWLPSPLEEVTSLVSKGAASIHNSQEQEKKKMQKKERETVECNMQLNQSEIQTTCVSNLLFFKIYFKGEEHGSKPHANFTWNLFPSYVFSEYIPEVNWQRLLRFITNLYKKEHSSLFMARQCHVQGAVRKEAEIGTCVSCCWQNRRRVTTWKD